MQEKKFDMIEIYTHESHIHTRALKQWNKETEIIAFDSNIISTKTQLSYVSPFSVYFIV